MSQQARTIDGLFDRIEKMAANQVSMQKTITDLGRDTSQRAEAIGKTLLAANGRGGGAHAAVGFDGANECSLVEIASCGRRQKTLGIGNELRAMWVHSSARPDVIGWEGGDVNKHLNGQKFVPVTKSGLAEAAGNTGGFMVAPQFYMNLLRLSVEEAKVRPRCTTIPMNSRTLFVPALDHSITPATGTTAYLGGLLASWQPEAATISQTQPKFRQIELVARDLVFTMVASNQLLQDSAIALDTLLTTLFTEGMAWFYDYYILRGDGASQPRGLLNSNAGFTQVSTGSAVFTLEDAANMMSHLLSQSWDNAVWIMHPSVLPQLITMSAGGTTSNYLVWLNPSPYSGEGGPAAQKLPLGFFMGLPIIFTEKLPALAAGSIGSVVLADLSKQLVGDRLAVQIESSPWPFFTSNQTVWRVIARWDSDNWLNAPVIQADGSYQMASIVKHKAATS